jgi:chromosome segregation ATPase
MSDEDLKKENDALKAKVEGFEKKLEQLSNNLDEQKAAKTDVIKQRDELKAQIKASDGKKETDNASVDQLKELLKENQAKLDSVEKARETDKIEAKVIAAAQAADFVTDKNGKINAKILKSELDFSKLHLDDDGEVIGLTSMLDKVRENSSYLFSKKKAAAKETITDPKNKQGEDLSDEALVGKSFAERRAIVAKRGERFDADKTNNLPSGMTGQSGKVTEPPE